MLRMEPGALCIVEMYFATVLCPKLHRFLGYYLGSATYKFKNFFFDNLKNYVFI